MAQIAIAAAIGAVTAAGSYLLLGSQSQKNRVEGARLGSSNLTTSTEGAGVTKLFGRQRLDGQIIWATQFKETVNTTTTTTQSGGKGGGASSTTETTEYTYSISLAIAFCEGNSKTTLSRMWADGKEVDLALLNFRYYPGSQTQGVDPKIEEIQGAGNAPAYRGVAYVVIEDMELAAFGNRVPQITAEIVVPIETDDPVDIQNSCEAFCLIPASGETIYSPSQVDIRTGGTEDNYTTKPDNVHNAYREPDVLRSLADLTRMQDDLDALLIVVAWFGDDLRAGNCTVRPKQEDVNRALTPAWSVGTYDRTTAAEVSKDGQGRPIYGGTPSDQSVTELIQYLNGLGKRVVFYPFILMDVTSGNTLPNPYSDNASGVGQSAFPWRGRITCSPADGFAGSPNNTATAATQVNAFFDEYDVMVEHYADLCAAAGGVDAFIVGTELPGLTRVRSAAGVYPAVSRLRTLAAYAKTTLPASKIGYAADWSEWVDDAADGLWFHLDPLWSDDNIDFCGVDNYLPMSDWRDGTQHLDYDGVNGPVSEFDPDYLAGQIEGGEYFDYFYANQADRDDQVRTPILDVVYRKPWVYKRKAFREWWSSPHHNRPNNLEDDLGDNTHNPLLYTSISGAILTASTEPAYGAFGPPLDVASNGSRADRARVHSNAVDGTAGKRYVLRAWAKQGTSNEFRIIFVHNAGNVQLLYVYSTDALSSLPSVQTINSVNRYDLGGNIYLFELDVTLNVTDTSVWLEIGPLSSTLGEYVTLLGASIQEHNVSTTGWVPHSKPIWFTEFGVPAVNKGTNQPNVFYDPKSSESAFPYYSSGLRDDFIQRIAVETTLDYWRNNSPANGGLTMVEPQNMFVWTWDARPFPDYPVRTNVWSDGDLWFFGHWFNGRIESVPLPRLVATLCRLAGLTDDQFDTDGLYGAGALVRGFQIDRPETIRASLETLMQAYLFDGFESEGKIKFLLRSNTKTSSISDDDFVVADNAPVGVSLTRGQETDLPTSVKVTFIDEFNNYNSATVDGKTSRGNSQNIEEIDVPITLSPDYARSLADGVVQQRWIERQSGSMSLPPSLLRLDPGDAITFPVGGNSLTGRLTVLALGQQRDSEFTAFDPGIFNLPAASDDTTLPAAANIFGAATALFMDLPLFTGNEDFPHAPRVVAYADPWPGGVNVYRLLPDATYQFNLGHGFRNPIGELNTPLTSGPVGTWDRVSVLDVTFDYGALSSVPEATALESALALGVYNAVANEWEVIQFATATLTGTRTYNVTDLLRGQLGTEHAMPASYPAGARVVLLEPAFLSAVAITDELSGEEQTYSWGPSRYPQTDQTYQSGTFTGKRVGLRPYAPTGVKLATNATKDLIIDWKRRTRFGGDSWTTEEPPLNEETEQYRVRVYDASTVVHEAVTTSPTYTYAAAQQTADFGSTQSTLKVGIAQYGAAFGGYGITNIDTHAIRSART